MASSAHSVVSSIRSWWNGEVVEEGDADGGGEEVKPRKPNTFQDVEADVFEGFATPATTAAAGAKSAGKEKVAPHCAPRRKVSVTDAIRQRNQFRWRKLTVHIKRASLNEPFGLCLNASNRVMELHGPAEAAGVHLLDSVEAVDGKATGVLHISEQVRDLLEMDVSLHRPAEVDLLAVAEEEDMGEFSAFVHAADACAHGDVETLVAALQVLAPLYGASEADVAESRQLTAQEARALAAATGVHASAGQRLVEVAAAYGQVGVVDYLDSLLLERLGDSGSSGGSPSGDPVSTGLLSGHDEHEGSDDGELSSAGSSPKDATAAAWGGRGGMGAPSSLAIDAGVGVPKGSDTDDADKEVANLTVPASPLRPPRLSGSSDSSSRCSSRRNSSRRGSINEPEEEKEEEEGTPLDGKLSESFLSTIVSEDGDPSFRSREPSFRSSTSGREERPKDVD
jgi:hypothetical protein